MVYLVDRLPPGQQCVANEDDKASLAAYLDAVRRAQELERRDVRIEAATEFGTDEIVDRLLVVLDAVRLANGGQLTESNHVIFECPSGANSR